MNTTRKAIIISAVIALAIIVIVVSYFVILKIEEGKAEDRLYEYYDERIEELIKNFKKENPDVSFEITYGYGLIKGYPIDGIHYYISCSDHVKEHFEKRKKYTCGGYSTLWDGRITDKITIHINDEVERVVDDIEEEIELVKSYCHYESCMRTKQRGSIYCEWHQYCETDN